MKRFDIITEADARTIDIGASVELARGGPLGPVMDVLFIRRALNQALTRTLGRFAVEAAEEAAL